MNLQSIIGRTDHSYGASTLQKTTDDSATPRTGGGVSQLTPGDTISGKVVSEDNGYVKIDLGSGQTVSARLDQNISLPQGETVLFEVKGSSSGTVSLSPMMTNTDNSSTAATALEVAGLGVTTKNLQMVNEMMKEGMSINRQELLAMSGKLDQTALSDIAKGVRLVNLGVSVNQENIAQLTAYDNYEHQIRGAINDLSKQLPDAYGELADSGEGVSGQVMYRELLDLFVSNGDGQDNTGLSTPIGEILTEEERAQLSEAFLEAGLPGEVVNQTADGTLSVREVLEQIKDLLPKEEAARDQVLQDGKTISAETDILPEEGQNTETNRAGNEGGVQVNQNPQNLNGEAALSQGKITITDSVDIQTFTDKQLVAASQISEATEQSEGKAFLAALKLTSTSETSDQLTESFAKEHQLFSQIGDKILRSQAFSKLLGSAFDDALKLTPEQVGKQNEVKDYYNRLTESVSRMMETMGKHLPVESEAAQTVTNLGQNLQFMNELNHMFPYIQLPLKMAGGEAHGDLYVYSNKKNLGRDDGTVTALLHLDMDHLGPMDVYVSMNSANKVNTHFYLPDEESLDLIASHIDVLNERLSNRGYSLAAEYTNRDIANGAVDQLVGKSVGVPISVTSFDARA